MIYDKIANAFLYKEMNLHWDIAVCYILTHDVEALPLGKTGIDSANVFRNKMKASTLPASPKQFEMHRKYMDIQIDLQGSGAIETGDVGVFHCADFSVEKNEGVGECPVEASCVLTPGSFAVRMAGEPHKPDITAGSDTTLVKCVLKACA